MAKVRKSKRKQKKQSNRIGIWIAAGGALLVVLVIALIGLNQSSSSVDTAAYDDFPEEWINRNVLGDPDASITIETWEDFL